MAVSVKYDTAKKSKPNQNIVKSSSVNIINVVEDICGYSTTHFLVALNKPNH